MILVYNLPIIRLIIDIYKFYVILRNKKKMYRHHIFVLCFTVAIDNYMDINDNNNYN